MCTVCTHLNAVSSVVCISSLLFIMLNYHNCHHPPPCSNQSNTQECLQRGELPSICGVIQTLREICNQPSLEDLSLSSKSLPSWCLLDQDPPRPFSSILGYDPLANISLDQVNLVFLSQELTTTGMVTIILRHLVVRYLLVSADQCQAAFHQGQQKADIRAAPDTSPPPTCAEE